MSHRFKHIILLLTTLSGMVGFAQQDPQFTHYMYNMSVINPAYATDSPGTINIGGLYRTQWVGAVGAPKTVTAFVHSPVASRLEAGVSIVSDEIGDVVKENNVYADIAYVFPVSENNKLSFGVKAGATFFDANFNGFQYSDTDPDPAFANNIHRVFPNVGVGTYFFGDNYYMGISVPNLLRTKHLEHQDAISTIGVEEIHYFITGGYVFTLSENWKLKPATMIRAVKGAPMAFDLTLNTLINNRFELGAGYRIDDAVSGLAGFYITPDLRIGYSYDYTLTNLGSYNSGTHEIFLLWDLNLGNGIGGKGFDKSPRFF
ncbi:type IX secretion system membrane protein PorP/SprF [Flavobacterium sp. MAH-1]|uniref:Type IX secretion system membrane protein PorP/SprF n=1 Tax=Flavobacterium agri TaxID=2743471 RepID=A0A7Y9C8I9_9FLAO|nr:type IX secretion system membrane protein PorP/SprF [Flavobacterium agri]NUY82413.1 type IX secretion system membrane protein PorP/SprF [Flavobacterium agri]NYA72437.1 type IX secretion system membrane protein PorP/SprF [Flavobacterium agri]